MKSPLISIIIPLFNRFSYTNRSIDSVINQNYKFWELIIIDDYSNEEFILDKKYRELDNIILLRNIENMGSGLSRQRGLNLAKGEYVAFLDSDDFYHEDWQIMNDHVLTPYRTLFPNNTSFSSFFLDPINNEPN